MASGFEFGEFAPAVGCAELLRRREDAIAVVVMFETISGEIIYCRERAALGSEKGRHATTAVTARRLLR